MMSTNSLVPLFQIDNHSKVLKFLINNCIEIKNSLAQRCPLRSFLRTTTSQFHTDPINSTHLFNTRTTPCQHPKSLSSTPTTPQFNTKIPHFHTKNPSVQHTAHFHTKNPSNPHIPQFNTENPSAPLIKSYFLSVELRDFWC